MSHPFQKRLLKELKTLKQNNLPGVTLVEETDDVSKLVFSITLPPDSDGVLHSIYKSSSFYLQFIIDRSYPVECPQVQFVKFESDSEIPIHPHIYSNGHICLDILGSGWTPACSIESVILSIQSMLSTNTINERPEGDMFYSKTASSNPKRTNFIYDDDTV